MSDFLRYDKNNVITKGARVLLAPAAAALPEEQEDIYDPVSPYDPVGAGANAFWDAGATSAPPTIGRNLTINDVVIQQDDSPIRREPTQVVRSLVVPFAEMSQKLLEVLEVSGLIDTTAARVKVHHGSIPDLPEYRIVLAVRKGISQGLVTEGAGAGAVKRGCDLIWVGYRGSISGDNVQVNFGRGDIAGGSITFDLVPDPEVTAVGTETGYWLIEKPRTIAIP